MRLLKKGRRKGSKISTRAKYFPLKKNCEFNRDHPVSSSSSSFEQRGIRTGCTRGRKMCVRLCARCYTSVKSVERKKRKKKKRNGAIRSVKVLTGTFPLSSATRGGPPRGRRRRDRAVPSCGPTRPAPYPCPFASPCRDPAPSPDPSSPLSPILCLAACPCARSPCSSLAPSLVHVPGFCPTLFRPQAAKEATLETKIHAILIKLYSLSLFLLIEISIIRSIFRGISIYA